LSAGDRKRLSARECANLARKLYVDGPLLPRKMQHFRPYICPFEALVDFVPGGARVLDIGCGAGLFLGLAATLKPKLAGFGLDASATAIEAARCMARRRDECSTYKGRLAFEKVSTEDCWPEGPFDLVSMIDVVHHIPPARQKKFIEEAAKRVAPGGILLHKDMCSRPLWRAAANRLHDLALARQWIHELNTEAAKACVCTAAFEVIHAERINRLWYGHDLIVFRKTS
jgi:2-polyprenyl-3-methyl-5-hydroxy-6-metoxy-1,4-benzoquinol methylase